MSKDWGIFDWVDPFCLDDQLTEDELLVKDTAANYAKDKLPLELLTHSEMSTHTERYSTKWVSWDCLDQLSRDMAVQGLAIQLMDSLLGKLRELILVIDQ